MKPISTIAKKYNIKEKDLILYGNHIAKLNLSGLPKTNKGKLILVTATSPTSSGEGKTTISINLTDALNKLGKKAVVALRKPSIGPVFGVKGGATGAGKASIVPENEINLHFTGDIHAITCANNLISAVIDNEVYQGSKLNIDPNKIVHTRVMDMNDRSLRSITVKINKNTSYTTRFDITAACELMTIFCLAKDKKDFEARLNNILVAHSKKNKPIFVKDLKITKALMAIVENCFKPNIVQTLEGNLAFVNGGPFANISIGVSTSIATQTGLKLADYTITEAGFGADLGAEKFINTVCQINKLGVSCIVLVSTIKSIIEKGNGKFEKGLANLDTHINHLLRYNIPLIVAINKFANDSKTNTNKLAKHLDKLGIAYAFDTGFVDGGKGGIALAKQVIKVAKQNKIPKFIYKPTQDLKTKIETIVHNCYGIKTVLYSDKAKKLIKQYSKNNFYVCMSKKPGNIETGFNKKQPVVVVQDILLNTGSKLVVVLCDKVFRMPGLPANPKAKA
ncbi:MAG: formate--tetrahydrofolate ligase [Mycoplasmoidaceae bacterium]|nr:formate--tetrahydrofolate ligase [Mycoplasmoidaceae bacterium]